MFFSMILGLLGPSYAERRHICPNHGDPASRCGHHDVGFGRPWDDSVHLARSMAAPPQCGWPARPSMGAIAIAPSVYVPRDAPFGYDKFEGDAAGVSLSVDKLVLSMTDPARAGAGSD